MTSASELQNLVTLKSGLTVPIDALRLLWQLEDRGLSIRSDGDGLAVGPRDLLSDADRDLIRQHRDDLCALVRYCEAVQ